LHSQQNNFLRRSVYEAQSAHQVREAQQMNTLRDRKIVNGLTFESPECAGTSARVHCIENQEMRNASEAFEEIEAQCPSFDDPNLRRKEVTPRECMQREHSDCIVGPHQIAKA
jgi:hypothetical protein